MTDIRHAHLYGTRESKYEWLNAHDVLSTDWNEISPQSPFYLLIPQNTDLLSEYQEGWKITEGMPINSSGIKTHRDHFVVDFDLSKLQKRIENFVDLNIQDNEIVERYDIQDTRDWKLGLRRKSLSVNSKWKNNFTKCLYRPFDIRSYYHHEDVVELPRNEVMSHIINQENLSLLTSSRVEVLRSYDQVLCSDLATQNHTLCLKEVNYILPLYTYPDINNSQQSTETEQRRPNFSDEFLAAITNKLGYTPTPEAIFYYIYATFHCPTYRERYKEFLKIDFPRVPLTRDDRLFQQLGRYGEELVALHLMKSPKLAQHITEFVEMGGNSLVDAGHPKYANGAVTINKKGDRFASVPENVWNFYVGGYQVCNKWLKDRKGRTLSPEDIQHYQKIVVALHETISLMTKIDAAIPSFPIE
jgi:predicted helicase